MKSSGRIRLRLYVAGEGPNSVQAVVNLRSVCEELLPGAYEIEVVDVFAAPEQALADGVFLTPTLIRQQPPPVVRVIGSLGEREPLLKALGLRNVQ